MSQRVLLVISAGIAAYKSLELIRLLKGDGHHVSVVMTQNATEFVTPLSVQTLAGTEPHIGLFSLAEESRIGHIALSRDADVIVVYPATANIIAKLRHGFADDLASTVLLATDTPIFMAPAMNSRMWLHPATQENVSVLKSRGISFIGPDEGEMACGEYGPGRASAPDDVVRAVSLAAPSASRPASSLSVLVTAGPTHERIDPVRFIANHSSGKQGYAIAAEFAKKGAKVTLVTGPTQLPTPYGVTRVDVTSAVEMQAACRNDGIYDIAVCVAAVGDWRTTEIHPEKIKKKSKGAFMLSLSQNPDILAELAAPGAGRPRLVIGFAAETDNMAENAARKRRVKQCDWIVANQVDASNAPFGGDDNQVTIFTEDGAEIWPKMTKERIARLLVDRSLSQFFSSVAPSQRGPL